MKISFRLNGNNVDIDTDPVKPLLRVLREELNVTSVKEGCGRGECGTCTVLLDEQPVTSCLVPVVQVADRDVMTLEGLESKENVQIIQEALVKAGAVQCGFCTPGIIISAYSLLERVSRPSRKEIKRSISGNICRCTGYTKIVKGIEKAAEMRADTLR